MAEPPAVVERTFEFAGGLQLHRLVEPARFYCVDCRQDKTAIRIATKGGDWTQTICGGCLHALRKGKAQRKREKKAANAALKAANAALKAAIAAAKAEQRRAAARRRIDHLPDDLAPELIDACLHASRQIRLERQVEYPRPVVLECDLGELTLLPIAGTETPWRMPFRLSKGTEPLEGELELVLDGRGPLPLLIGEDVAVHDATTAWTCALLGFADTTCIELEPVEPSARRESARPRSGLSSPASHRRPSTRTLPRTWSWPAHLKPVGRWIPYSDCFVVGHKRRLPGDWTASDEQRDLARRIGIELRPHETWVRPHTRGVPDDIEMRFLWHAPAELKLSYTRPTSRGEGG